MTSNTDCGKEGCLGTSCFGACWVLPAPRDTIWACWTWDPTRPSRPGRGQGQTCIREDRRAPQGELHLHWSDGGRGRQTDPSASHGDRPYVSLLLGSSYHLKSASEMLMLPSHVESEQWPRVGKCVRTAGRNGGTQPWGHRAPQRLLTD